MQTFQPVFGARQACLSANTSVIERLEGGTQPVLSNTDNRQLEVQVLIESATDD